MGSDSKKTKRKARYSTDTDMNSTITLDYNKIIQDRITSSVGLDSYKKIMETVRTVNVAADRDFQRTFDGFYKVRRDAAWREQYYLLFEQCKNRANAFADVVTELYTRTGNVEASFASKMLATLAPQKPIWDRYVLQNLQIKPPRESLPKLVRLAETIRLYDELEMWYTAYLPGENAQAAIRKFDELLPDYRWISETKKVDFYLWGRRE